MGDITRTLVVVGVLLPLWCIAQYVSIIDEMSDIVSATSVGLLVLLEFVCSSQQQQQHRGASEQLLWTFFKAVTKGLASSAFVMTALHALHAASGRDSVSELLHPLVGCRP